MNLIYVLEVQDGESRRNQLHWAELPDGSTHEDINAKGEEILAEHWTGEQEGEWRWDNYYENMARYYSYKVIPCDESFQIFKELVL